jgi:aminoglycoside phosphotransferase family enzyme
MLLFVAGDKIFEQILSMRRIDQESVMVATAWAAGKRQTDADQYHQKEL